MTKQLEEIVEKCVGDIRRCMKFRRSDCTLTCRECDIDLHESISEALTEYRAVLLAAQQEKR